MNFGGGLAITFGIFLSSAALAEEAKLHPFSLECESLGSLQQRVQSCTENTLAVESAKDCYRQLMQAWKDAPKDLNKNYAFNKKNKERKQEESHSDAQKDYRRALDKLDNLIAVTDRNTELLTSYPLTMREDPNTEVDCYTDAFREVQNIVDKLEDRLDEGRVARGGAELRRDTSQVRDERIDTYGSEKFLKADLSKGATTMGKATHVYRDSDVTGIKGEEEDHKLKVSNGAPFTGGPGRTYEKIDMKKMKNESDPAWVDSFLENYGK